MRHFLWSLHSLLTLTGPWLLIRRPPWINGESQRAEAVAHHSFISDPVNDTERGEEREKRRVRCQLRCQRSVVYLAPPCVRGRDADIMSLWVEHSHKTCFLYSFPNVNNTEGANTMKGLAWMFSSQAALYKDVSRFIQTRGGTFSVVWLMRYMHMLTWPSSYSVCGYSA